MKSKIFYLDTNKNPIRVESSQKLDPRREVYRLNLEKCKDLHGLPTIIVRQKMKEDWEDEFEQEMQIYDKLKDLQGIVIPVFLDGVLSTTVLSLSCPR